MGILLALLFTNISFLAGALLQSYVDEQVGSTTCVAISHLTHYFLLAFNNACTTQCYFLFRTIVKSQYEIGGLLRPFAFVWIIPIFFVLPVILVQQLGNTQVVGINNVCWFASSG